MQSSMRWRVRVLGGAAVALLPWMGVLAMTLPDPTPWVLLDLGEAVCLAATALLLHRGNGWHRLSAAGAALLLTTDAVCDVGTSASGSDLLVAVGMALLAELPMAAVCAALVLRRRRPAAGAGSLTRREPRPGWTAVRSRPAAKPTHPRSHRPAAAAGARGLTRREPWAG